MKRRRLGRARIGSVAVVVVAVGCGLPCGTDIGCIDGLTVELTGQVAESFTVTALTAGGEPQVVACGPDRDCGRIFFEILASQVTLRYESAQDTVQRVFDPAYEGVRPGGVVCEVVCQQATVVFDVGE